MKTRKFETDRFVLRYIDPATKTEHYFVGDNDDPPYERYEIRGSTDIDEAMWFYSWTEADNQRDAIRDLLRRDSGIEGFFIVQIKGTETFEPSGFGDDHIN